MRVTETRMIENASAAVARARSRVAEAGEQLQSGMRVALPSKDVAAWSRAVRGEARQVLSEGRGNAIARSAERLRDVDRVLAGIGEALARARELAVQLANDTYTASERTGGAAEVTALRAHILALANTRGSDGEFILAGSAGQVAPFATTGTYLGNGVRRDIESAEVLRSTVGVTGEVLTATHGVDVLPTLDALALALRNNDGAGIRASLRDLETAIAQVSLARTDAGARGAALDEAERARREFEHALSRLRADAAGADPVAAASALAQSTTALQSAQAVAEHILTRVLQR